MSWTNVAYKTNLQNYGKTDGIKALFVYILIMGSSFFQGWLYTTSLSTLLLNSSQIWIPLILVILFVFFLHCSNEKLDRIGITTRNIKASIALGIVGGVLLLSVQTLLYMLQGKTISFSAPLWMNWIIFSVAAFEEEILFRGYIQTRLTGIIHKQWIAGIINSVLFLSIHYPVRWVVSGAISFALLSSVYVISLLALHFLCDAVYKRTNCLWGAVLLHIIYNAVGAMIVVL